MLKCIRNTSTDVEKTPNVATTPIGSWKHLHGRGEDLQVNVKSGQRIETPPRTWRRPGHITIAVDVEGNTSTDVEKTQRSFWACARPWKHLHGRGEDSLGPPGGQGWAETPPRTWRRQRRSHDHWLHIGNTSTDVEKTKRVVPVELDDEKHLHGRGEDP